MKVLVADDSMTMRMMVRSALSKLGVCRITEADNGLSALAALKREPFDLVLLDLHMPLCSGIEALAQIKAEPHTRGIPVILLTSDCSTQQAAAGLRLGAEAYLKKPCRPEELLAAVRAAAQRVHAGGNCASCAEYEST